MGMIICTSDREEVTQKSVKKKITLLVLFIKFVNVLISLLNRIVSPFNIMSKRTCSNCGWCPYDCPGWRYKLDTCWQWILAEEEK